MLSASSRGSESLAAKICGDQSEKSKTAAKPGSQHRRKARQLDKIGTGSESLVKSD